MKKAPPKAREGVEMRREYDIPWDVAVRGKYKRRAGRHTYFVAIDNDLKAVFPDADAVNNALRALADLAAQYQAKKMRRRRSA